MPQETNHPADSFLYGECVFTTPDAGSMALTKVSTIMRVSLTDFPPLPPTLRCCPVARPFKCQGSEALRTHHGVTLSFCWLQKVYEASTSANGVALRPLRDAKVSLPYLQCLSPWCATSCE